MARSTYYFELKKIDAIENRNADLAEKIIEIFTDNKQRYGVRRVYQELRSQGQKVNHKRIQRIMPAKGLHGEKPKEKYQSYKGKVGQVAENIINRNFSTTAPLQKWTTDVSQFNFP